MTPGAAGWIAVGVVVAAADGYALAKHLPTMSDEFNRHIGWGLFLLGGTVAHLLAHRRLHG